MIDILNFLDNWMVTKGVITETDTNKLSQFMSEFGMQIDKLSIAPDNGGTNLVLYS